MRKIIIYCFLVLFVGCEKEPFLTVIPSTVDFCKQEQEVQ